MRMPVRFSRSHLPGSLQVDRISVSGLSSLVDPSSDSEFLSALSALRFGRVFKTTSYARLPQLVAALKSLGQHFKTIGDVGASDGSASLDFIRELEHDRYLLIDKHPYVFIEQSGRSIYAYDGGGRLMMHQFGPFVVYVDPLNEWPTVAELLTSWFYRGALQRRDLSRLKRIALLNPSIGHALGPRLELIEHDIATPWTRGTVDLCIVANLLNKFHDPTSPMVAAPRTIHQLISPGGILALAENSPHERASLLRKTSAENYEVLERISGGSLSESFFLRHAI